MTELTKHAKSIIGTVVSNKMQKTIVIEQKRKVPHSIYGKYITKTSKFYAHDEENLAKIGDLVKIEFQRPISKLKRWKLTEILEKAHEV